MYYPKIYTIFKREVYGRNKGKGLVTPIVNNKELPIKALSLLRNIIIEEKIDGSNGSFEYYNAPSLGVKVERYYSRKNEVKEIHSDMSKKESDKQKSLQYIRETIREAIYNSKFEEWYRKNFSKPTTVKVFGEVYGANINNGQDYVSEKGKKDFIVFDIKIGDNCYLSPKDRNTVCKEIGLKHVPILGTLNQFPTFEETYDLLFRRYPKSIVAKEAGNDRFLEGFILRPSITLYTNKGRVIGKIKRKDFE